MFDFASAASTLKTISVLLAVVMVAYGGFILITSRDIHQRDGWKEAITGVCTGIILLYLAPLLASQFTTASYCGVMG